MTLVVPLHSLATVVLLSAQIGKQSLPRICYAGALRTRLASICTMLRLMLVSDFAGVGDEENAEAALAALKLSSAASSSKDGAVVQWRQRDDGGLELQHSHSLRQLTWHSRGDYFATVAPTGNTQVLHRGCLS